MKKRMNESRGASSRFQSRATLAASVALAALVGAGVAQAADSTDANASCRQETKRVAVWPKGPKSAQRVTRFEEREVTVCDGKVVSRRSSDEPAPADEKGG